MVVIIDAHTEPVNPPSASPVLTHAQIWAGVLFEIRNKALFFPSIDSSEVLSETEEEIVIRSQLQDHSTTYHTAGEHVTRFALSPPNKVYSSPHPRGPLVHSLVTGKALRLCLAVRWG